jgi:phage protein D
MPETPPLYAARPSVTLDGVDRPELSEGLITAQVEEDTEGLRRCEARFGNWGNVDGSVGFLYSDRRVLDFGRPFALRMGAGDKAAGVFSGRITGLQGHFPADGPPEITMLAEDRFQDLRMTRRTRTFEDTTAAAVIQQVASAHGLRPEVDVDGPTHPVLAQVNQSDLAFLRDLARRVDAEVWMEEDVLHAKARARRSSGPVTITYGRELREMSLLADLAGQRTAVAVSGWDVAAKEAIDAEATESAIRPELAGTTSGPRILEQAFGARRDRLVHKVPLTSSEATAVAEAALRRCARRFVTGRAITEGDGRIQVGTSVEVLGLGPAFNGRQHVTRVKHQFDPVRGYLTYFEVERPGLSEE